MRLNALSQRLPFAASFLLMQPCSTIFFVRVYTVVVVSASGRKKFDIEFSNLPVEH